MKKVFLFLMMAVAAVFFAGCQKDEVSPKSLSGTSWEGGIYDMRMVLSFVSKDAFEVEFRYDDGDYERSTGKYTVDGSKVFLKGYYGGEYSEYYCGIVSGNKMNLYFWDEPDVYDEYFLTLTKR